jgi:hypothetical protein
MKTHTIFCSASDRDVDVIARDDDWPSALAAGELACVEHGVRCTGTSCPVCARCLSAGERRDLRGGAPGPA